MTQRERVAPEAASEPVSTLPASALPVRLDPPARTAAGKTLTWDEIYASATPAQQSELLALAQRQGILYHHHLPPALRGLTFAERLSTLAEQALQGARRDAADAEQRCRRLQQDEPRLERFLQLVDQGHQLDAGLKAIEEARGRVPVEVERLAAS